jgi:acetyl/propionyl-CoA carboxylase alpha subunit
LKKLDAEINGQRMQGAVAKTGATTWYSLNGEVWTVEAATRSQRAGGRAAVDPNTVAAPMPGKIIKVMVQKNSNVALGETLIVMEAMKMEYTLKAALAGVVDEITCVVGQQVTLGSILVKLRTK